MCEPLSTPQIITKALRRAHMGELLQGDTKERLRQLQRARLKAQRQSKRLVDAFSAEVLTLDELLILPDFVVSRTTNK